MIAASPRPVTGGVDTHKDVHVAAVVDHLGAELDCQSFPNIDAGYVELAGWLRSHGQVQRVGIEGTSSYGAGLSRRLRDAGLEVVEVNRPSRTVRRSNGKSDPIDAVEAARAALSGRHAGEPKTGDGPIEAIRILRTLRRSAIGARTAAMNQIHSLLDTAPTSIHDRLAAKTITALITELATQACPDAIDDPTDATTWALPALARRVQHLDDEIRALDAHLDVLVATAAPQLLDVFGVGTQTAAALLVAAGDNPSRLRSEAGFAALCGVNPLPASSGRTTRHRLNRGGNRDANNALWRIAMVRMSHDPTTRAYVERRTQDGLSKREILRCLKRYIARQLYPIIMASTR